MKQIAIRLVEKDSYPWSIEEFDELAGVYYKATVMFPREEAFRRVYDIIYPEKLEAFLQSSEYKEYVVEHEIREEGFNLPDRSKVQSVSIKMDDPENIPQALKDAIDKLVVD
jgi:hypothetical protein